jgi:hypothetical protein
MARMIAQQFERPSRRTRRVAGRGYTLLEALFASTILSMVVLAVVSALSASQMQSFEGQKSILAAIAADNLLSELITLPYEDIRARDGQREDIGELVTVDGVEYPRTFWPLGREVTAEEEIRLVEDLSVEIVGLRVEVRVFDDARTLATIETFVPEPVE